MAATLPTGTVTFLFTDIEGSTRLWEAHPEHMRTALTRHDALLRQIIMATNGYVFKTVGDGFCAAFATASDAVQAALSAQLAFLNEPWPKETLLKTRMALHTGSVESRDNDYFGPPLNRVARLLATGHGGQCLLSTATQELVRGSLPSGAFLQDLGVHQLKDLARPEQVYQLRHAALPSDFPPIRSLSTHPNNLPQQITRFIGREKEMATVQALLENHRLVTLTGSGGTGKTRLSIQVAANTLENYPDGVWLVELAALSDPELVPQTVVSVLGLKEESGKSVSKTLVEFLADKKALLLLDNCEHLLDACAALADAIVRQCPRAVILASSREGLGITGESVYRVPSLALPDLSIPSTPESLAPFEAVRLFIDRAVLAQNAFAVTKANAPAVASICHRLDGIPLALELAAARARNLSVEEINSRLDQRFRLLTGGSRTALPRQQTLRSLIDWSYDLLSAEEKTLFRRLAVFADGWTLESAEAVCAGNTIEDWEIPDLLSALVNKSLVVYDADAAGKGRYHLLETVRQYARDRFDTSEDAQPVREKHLYHFLDLNNEAVAGVEEASASVWLDRLETEHDNLRTALAFSRETNDHADAALRIASGMQRFWEVRGYLSEGRKEIETTLAQATAGSARLRADALRALGTLARMQGDYFAARGALGESLRVHRDLNNKPGMVRALSNLGVAVYDQGDYAGARTLFEEALEIEREVGTPKGVAALLGNIGVLAREQGDLGAAEVLLREAVSILRRVGQKQTLANTLSNLGALAHDRGDFTAADAYYQESLLIRREFGDRSGTAISLINLGLSAKDQKRFGAALSFVRESLFVLRDIGDRRLVAYALEAMAGALAGTRSSTNIGRAARLWGAAQTLRMELGTPMPPNEQEPYQQDVALARATEGEVAFTTAWVQGSQMDLAQSIVFAMDAEIEEIDTP